MGLIRCDECHDWHDMDKLCPPTFEVYSEEFLGEKPEIFHAYNHEDAALKFAEHHSTHLDNGCGMGSWGLKRSTLSI